MSYVCNVCNVKVKSCWCWWAANKCACWYTEQELRANGKQVALAIMVKRKITEKSPNLNHSWDNPTSKWWRCVFCWALKFYTKDLICNKMKEEHEQLLNKTV